VSNNTYIKSTYIVETNFSGNKVIMFSFPADYGIKSIVVKISELSTGKIVVIINKTSKKVQRPSDIAKKLVEELMKELK